MPTSELNPGEQPLDQRFSGREVNMATSSGFRSRLGLAGLARRTLGICLLMLTVVLWTLSNFMTSSVLAGSTFNKPFFLVYLNISFFSISLFPILTRYLWSRGLDGARRDVKQFFASTRRESGTLHIRRGSYLDEEGQAGSVERLLGNEAEDDQGEDAQHDGSETAPKTTTPSSVNVEKLDFRATVKLSLQFCLLYFVSNYFTSACFEFTSVASGTILASTSGVWTLLCSPLLGIETFSLRKLAGVAASLVGIALTSTVDLTGNEGRDDGTFPHKTTGELAIGDAMALLSAVLYGVYVTVLKKRVGSEDKLDMGLFFGLLGFFNLVLLWPLFFLLDWTGLEPFAWPSSGKMWTILLVNAMASFIGDVSWAYAMLLTTPLVVTVGLSLSIPLSLVGEMIQYGRYASFAYCIGAAVVVCSFVFINNESHGEDETKDT